LTSSYHLKSHLLSHAGFDRRFRIVPLYRISIILPRFLFFEYLNFHAISTYPRL
jgi:hypothetical protein